MQLARSVQALVVILVLGAAGCLAGCGSGANQASSSDRLAAAKAVKADIRKSFQKKLEEAAAKRGPMRQGHPRAKSGP
jgi:hypothetical protein